jgi:hypothetical protein
MELLTIASTLEHHGAHYCLNVNIIPVQLDIFVVTHGFNIDVLAMQLDIFVAHCLNINLTAYP